MNHPVAHATVSSADTPSWRATVTDNPIAHAFADAVMVTHPGRASMMPPAAGKSAAEALDALLDAAPSPRPRRRIAYIHVPFCETRCLYCLFYINPLTNGQDTSRLYADRLIREMELWAGKHAIIAEPIEAVYFGGGTPTALEAEDILRILDTVHRVLPLANDCEITFEGRLSGFDDARMEACLEGGVNRFSLGVQTFDTAIRQSMGRRSNRDQLLSRLTHLSSYNEAAVVIDLIYGFPGQTLATWEADIRDALSLNLDGVDCYNLRIFPKAPIARRLAAGKLPPVPEHLEKTQMFEKSIEMLSSARWRRLSISHWASGTREHNYYNYFAKSRNDCFAFGSGAGGKIAGRAYMIDRDLKSWAAAVDRGEKPVSMLMPASPFSDITVAMAEQLELNYLDPAALERAFARPFAALWAPALENWQQAGLIVPRGHAGFDLTVAGQYWQTRLTQSLCDLLR